MAQEFAKKFYASYAWVRCRESYKKKVGGLCEDCRDKGFFTAGEIVHHIVPITPDNIDNPSITLSHDNLRLVCRECHALEHEQRERKRFIVLGDGTVLTPPIDDF